MRGIDIEDEIALVFHPNDRLSCLTGLRASFLPSPNRNSLAFPLIYRGISFLQLLACFLY